MTKQDRDLENFPREGEVYRHVRRGGSYTVVGCASLQTSVALNDETRLVIYRGEDGRLWARPAKEFSDGRFKLSSDADGN